MQVFGKTDTGRMRKNNEDSFFATSKKIGIFDALFIVCDGMGGHSYGEVASGLCVESFLRYVNDAPLTDSPAHVMSEAVFMANYAVFRESEGRKSQGMGTTLVAAGIIGDTAYIANIGDSRLYLLNAKDNYIRQITRDHSYAEEQVLKGKMERGSEEYKRHKNIITRAVGIYMDVEADQYELPLEDGDLLLLCSDGLTNMVPEIVVKNLALDDNFDIEKRVETLVNTANNNGGRDNITVILADISGGNR